MGKLRGACLKSRNSAVQSTDLSWTGQYKTCVQYDYKFTPVQGVPYRFIYLCLLVIFQPAGQDSTQKLVQYLSLA